MNTFRFEALEAALEMIAIVRPVIDKVARHDPDLARQMKRSASSAPSCLAEGNRRRGRDRSHLWTIALGSADEFGVQLRIARSWQYVPSEELDVSDAAVDRVRALTYRLLYPRR